MKKSAEIIGLPLISLSEGKELGTVQDLVINPQTGSVPALVINDGRWYLGAKLLPFNKVRSIGDYAVTVEASSDLIGVTAEYEPLLAAGVKIIGQKVLSTSGSIQGVVTEFFIDAAGKIVACEMTANETVSQLPAKQIRTFGMQALVINDANQPWTDETETSATDPIPAFTPDTQQAAALDAADTIDWAAAFDTLDAINPVNSEADYENTAERFDAKQRQNLLGKKASRRIATANGLLIVEQGGEITEEVLQKAKLAGKYAELSMSIQ